MKILETKQEKQSMCITIAFFVLFMLVFFLLKFSNTAIALPQLAGGGGGSEVAVNFGDSDFGISTNFTSEDQLQNPTNNEDQPLQDNELLVNEQEDSPTVKTSSKSEKKPEKTSINPTPINTKKPDQSTADAVNNLLSGNSLAGDGTDKTAGNKGKKNGTTAAGYNKTGGGHGSGFGDYDLAGRKPINKPDPKYICNEQGKVAVRIIVNKNGEVISAAAGARGTTNTSKCLAEQAQIAAKSTKWQADPSAPDKQEGTIIYIFSLQTTQ